jgi:diacylglycerol kinase family enzyme
VVVGAVAAAVAIAGLGGRFERRAAMRGLVAAAITAPGGPAAALTAMTTGAALESPPAAIPFAAAAAIAALRRRNPIDVLTACLAAAVALGTRKFWPVAPKEAAQLAPVFTQVDQRPSADGEGIIFIANANAGPALSGNPTEEIKGELPAAEIVEVEGPEEFAEALRDAGRRAVTIGVAGGDGTLNAGAAVAVAAKKPLMVVPAGTLNHLARDLGLIGVADAAHAVKHGQTVAMDVGLIDGKTFLNTASFGSYVTLVDARERLEAKIGKWPAAIVALVRVLRDEEPVEVELDGKRRLLWMIFIGNCRYHPSGFTPSWRERLDDGLLDIRVVDASKPYSRTRLIAAIVTGRLGRSRVYDQWRAERLEVKSLQGPLRLARDGETFDGSAEFTVEKQSRALAVFVPWK